ncbi:MAG TPA: cytochrome c3 family protein [Candidatus Acidoferrum sp.]|nr:cytochrome c3 family protein [Candidatus Acidoferrum sp.]
MLLFAWQPAYSNGPAALPQRQNSRSPHGALAIPCENCHTATAWRPIKAVPEFDHNKTKYPLRGMHEKVQCTQCHVKPVFTDVSKNCRDCHTDVHQSKMGTNCADCHTVQGWNVAVQQVKDHQNRFPLLGAHAAVQCDDCHKSAAVGQFQGLSTACVSCHLKDYQQTQTMGGNVPNHVSAQFPQTCETCHTFDSWLGASVNHAAPPINFPLTNGHANAPCASCHVGGNYNLQIAATDCGNSQCHLTTWQQTTNPQHAAAATVFPIAGCSNCHNTVSWQNATFDHSTTGFPLTNSHQLAPAGKVASCSDCHINNNYNLQIQPTDCGNSQCHLNTNYGGGWQGTTNPVHSAAGTPFAAANCSNCHNTVSFLTATFDHASTGWPLLGSHQLAPAGKVSACTDCHVNNNYTFTSANTDCFGCHQAAWNSTPSFGGNVPNHITAGFPTSLCSQCHDTIAWTDSTFNHANTGFPLTNSHQIAPAGKVTGCDQCHLGNYSSLAIQPTDCGNSQCHLNTNYGGGWQGTTNPVHSSAGAPFAAANCANCHNTVSFLTATFDHATTGWPLTGSHQLAPAGKVVACTDCHIGNNYNLTAANTDCYGCHQTAWQSTTTIGGSVPNHITAGFSTSMCSTCHDTVLWSDGKFDHTTTGFPLQGPHMLPPRTTVTGAIGPMVNACTDCHIGGNYTTGYPTTDCYGCHQSYYTNAQTYGTNVPNHITASYPTTCASCHTTWVTTAWLGAVFSHTAFVIPHHASICADCHINSTNYATFSCINACHTGVSSPHTSKTQTDSNHSGVSGYAYNATICVNCHKS